MRLRVVMADGRRFEREAQGDELVVGRSSHTGLSIPDRALSREHARFFRMGDAWFVEDLRSHNGTRVNDRNVVSPTPLAPGDRVSVGESVLMVELPGGAAAPAPEPEGSFYRSAEEILSGVLDTGEAVRSGAEAGRRAIERLRLLNDVHQALGRSISLDGLLELILDRVFTHLAPQEGAIYLRDAEGRDFCAARRSSLARPGAPLHSRSLFHEVIDKGKAARILDTALDERFAAAESLMSAGVRSLIAAPLLDPQGALGMIVLGSTLTTREFTEEDVELLVSLASVAAMRIRNVRLVAEAMERQKLEQEIRLARQIQVALLPAALPGIPGYELFGGNLPSRGVSGDFYKVVPRPALEEVAFLLADVSGKGIAASLLTASLEALTALPLESGASPESVCEQVSRLLYQRTPPEKYATAILAVLLRQTGQIRFVNAGHNPGLVVRCGGAEEWLAPGGVPLGLLPGSSYTARATSLAPGDTLVLYTDGLTEAVNPEDEEFGATRLLEACRRGRDLPPRALARALERELDDFVRGVPFADDRTLLVVRRLS